MQILSLESSATQSVRAESESDWARPMLLGVTALMALSISLPSIPEGQVHCEASADTHFDAPVSTGRDDYTLLRSTMSQLHRSLLDSAKELDPLARKVLAENLWDLYLV